MGLTLMLTNASRGRANRQVFQKLFNILPFIWAVSDFCFMAHFVPPWMLSRICLCHLEHRRKWVYWIMERGVLVKPLVRGCRPVQYNGGKWNAWSWSYNGGAGHRESTDEGGKESEVAQIKRASGKNLTLKILNPPHIFPLLTGAERIQHWYLFFWISKW